MLILKVYRNIFLATLFFTCVSLSAQNQNKYQANTALDVTGILKSEKAIKIGVKLPYEGVVEITLYDSEKKRLGSFNIPLDKGQHYIWISRKKLHKGKEYKFTLMYKGTEYKGNFTN